MNIYDFIRDIASNLGLNYQHGSYKTVQKYLMDSAKNGKPKTERYPMLLFITSDKVEKVDVNPSLHTDYPLHLVIINITDKSYSTQKRLDNNFIPILYPLYDSLITALRPHSKNPYSELPHDKVDHFYYSASTAEEANKLAEYLDAIELTGLNILIDFNEKNCI